jgi:serpin B
VFTQNDRSQSVSAVGPLVTGNTEFALALYQKLRAKPGNLFFSPYSISTALAMTYAGARGRTALEMAQALRFLLPPEALHAAFAHLEARLSASGRRGRSNSAWPMRCGRSQGIRFSDYLALVAAYYGTQITAVDYGTPQQRGNHQRLG